MNAFNPDHFGQLYTLSRGTLPPTQHPFPAPSLFFHFSLKLHPCFADYLLPPSISRVANNLEIESSMKTPVHTQVTFVSFLAPTNTKGARIKLEDGTTGKARTIPYNYALNNPEQGALAWFAEHNVHPVGRASYGRNIEQAVLIHAPEDSSALFALFVRP